MEAKIKASLGMNIRAIHDANSELIGYVAPSEFTRLPVIRQVDDWIEVGGWIYAGNPAWVELYGGVVPPPPPPVQSDIVLTHWPTADKLKSGGGNTWGNPPGHEAVDLYAPVRAPIFAAVEGRVVMNDFEPGGYGRYLILQHDGFQTLYAHLDDRTSVQAGDRVRGGFMLGISGATGNVSPPGAMGAHLHFEIRTDAGRVDPWPVLLAIGK